MKVGDLVRPVGPTLGFRTLPKQGVVIAVTAVLHHPAMIHARVSWGEYGTFWHEPRGLEVIGESR